MINNYLSITDPFACSHHRAPDYFGESIRSFRGFWGWPCGSYINYLLGFCPKSEQLFVAGEDCRSETRGMYLVTTNSVSPFAIGRWTDLVGANTVTKLMAFTRADPLQQKIDPWGKVEGNFNNLDHFPTPYSQDPNGLDWPYFNRLSEDSHKLVDMKVAILSTSTERSDSDSNLLQKLNKQTFTNYKADDEGAFIRNYKNNLTEGFIDDNVFSVPEVVLSD